MRSGARRSPVPRAAGLLAGGAVLAAVVGPAGPAGAATPGPAALPRRADAVSAGPAGPGLHWVLRSGQRTLVVDLVDTTGVAWPVRAAARSWRTPQAAFVLAAACRAGYPCVVVTDGAAGASGWAGTTTARPGLMFSFTSPVRVVLNDSYPLTAAQRRAVACHELGHALGLGHNERATSCLRPDPAATGPDSADLAALSALYPPETPLSRRR